RGHHHDTHGGARRADHRVGAPPNSAAGFYRDRNEHNGAPTTRTATSDHPDPGDQPPPPGRSTPSP
ncbi:hypothetical protein, partial [Mycobacterium szulgai]|uniref:hypothetical protein n=1 Tax=Mycobacterium szulgai TaxID=1787 RepID=UPI0021F363C0